MGNDEIAGLLLQVSSAAGVAHAGMYIVSKRTAEIILYHRLPDAARRKMRRKWNELIAGRRNPPTMRIKTHRVAMNCALHNTSGDSGRK